MTMSLLAELERVELESRARRLAAEAEVERRVAAAKDAAEAIAATGEREIDVALEALRDRYREFADEQIAASEAELEQCDREARQPLDAGPAFDAAVEAIVAAVLGETET